MASTPPVNQSVRLTKLVVDRTPLPAASQLIIRDAELKGFGLRITAGGAKSFIVEKRVGGRVRRFTLGRYPGITAEQARKEAQKLLGRIISGVDVHAERQRAEALSVTLGAAFRDFLKVRSPNLKERTLYDYRRLMEVALGDWQTRAVSAITKDMVASRHQELGETRGEAYANLAMRFLRSLLNFARAQYEDPTTGNPIIAENPVARLTHTRAWYRIDRRQTVIRTHQLPAWHQGVMVLKGSASAGHSRNASDSVNVNVNVNAANPVSINGVNPVNVNVNEYERSLNYPPTADTVADYLLLLLYTGLRRNEAATLLWDHVDLISRTLTIPDPKNHEPLTLPLSDVVHELLSARATRAINNYVFPGGGREGRLIEPRNQIARVVEASGVTFTLHDLRRTFITIAESLDIPAYAIKRLVNHKMRGDVTAGYIVSDVERLRRPMQQITDFIRARLVPTTSTPIVDLARQRTKAAIGA